MEEAVWCGGCGRSYVPSPEARATGSARCPSCNAETRIAAMPTPAVGGWTPPAVPGPMVLLSAAPGPHPPPAAPAPVRPCPRCGARQPWDAAKCAACGNWIPALAPQGVPVFLPPPGSSGPVEVVRRFRRQAHLLGGLWLFFGLTFMCAGFVYSTDSRGPWLRDREMYVPPEAAYVLLAVGVPLVIAAICTILKRIWAVHLGMIVWFLLVVANVVQLVQGNGNVVGLLIAVGMLAGGSTVLKAAGKLRAMGIPLYARPTDFR